MFVIVDVPDSLMKQMNLEAGKKVIRNIQTLLVFAKKMAVRVLITEQHPEGLGRIQLLRSEDAGRKQVILTGIETHGASRPCGGRRNLFKEEISLVDQSEMDEKKGAMISTTEIIAFRLLKEAGTEEFKKLS